MKTVRTILAFLLALHVPFYTQQPTTPSFPPMPSEEEMREAFNQLMNMSDEERKQLETEALNQLANLSENDLKQIETDMMNRIASLTPEEREELERRGREMLTAWGIDPDTGKPLEQEKTEKPVEKPKETPTPIVTPSKPSPATHGDLHFLLDQLIHNLQEIRHTACLDQFAQLSLDSFAQELDQFIQLLMLINKSHHHQRLLDKEYASIIPVLERLHKTIQRNHLSVSTKEALLNEPSEMDPYETLGIPYTATSKEIEKAYERLADKNDPINVRKRLESEGATEKELEKAEKEARIGFNLIVDAYESLSNQHTRAQLDRERKARQHQQKSSFQEARAALLSNSDAIGNALHQQGLLVKLNDFLQKYEPEKLAQLNAMKAAEEKRKEEYKKLCETRPTKTPSLPSTPGRPHHPYRHDYDNHYPVKQPMPSGDNRPSPAKPETKKDDEKKSDGKKDKKDEKEDKENKKSEPTEQPKKEESSKKPSDKPADAPSQEDIQKIGSLFNSVYQAAHGLTQTQVQLQESLEGITSAKDLLSASSTLSQQQQLLTAYATHLNNLQQAMATTKDPALLTTYKETWNTLTQDQALRKTDQLVHTIQRALQRQEPEEARALITAEQSQQLVNWVNIIGSITQATQSINRLVK